MNSEKYIFISNVKIEGSVTAQALVYDSATEAEIKYHDEVSYALKLDTIEIAHFAVVNEYGTVIDNLERVIENDIFEDDL